jgi:hypothetical protein
MSAAGPSQAANAPSGVSAAAPGLPAQPRTARTAGDCVDGLLSAATQLQAWGLT